VQFAEFIFSVCIMIVVESADP